MTAGGHAIVVGGGITGLAAAWRLAYPPRNGQGVPATAWPRVTLLEASPRLGGKIRTIRAGSLQVEAGPDGFLARKRALGALAEELGLSSRLTGMGSERGAFILYGGQLHPIPAGLRGIVPTNLVAVRASTLLSESGQARVRGDLNLPGPAKSVPDRHPLDDAARVRDETLGSLSRRHFGDEWTERLVDPLFAGIHAASADRLSVRATYPELLVWERERGSLIRAALASPPATADVPESPFLSLADGLASLVAALEEALRRAGVRIVAGAAVSGLVPAGGGGYRVTLASREEELADAVVLAVPAHVAAGLLERANPDAAEPLAAIPFASTAVVALAYPRAELPRRSGTGFLVPRGQGRTITACTYISSKWPHMAPPGLEVLRCFVGRRDEEDALAWPDDVLERAVRRDLEDVLGITAVPAWSAVFRWPLGFPQYDVGHLDRVEAAERALQATPGLTVAGASYRGLGLPDCVAQGLAAYRPPASDQ